MKKVSIIPLTMGLLIGGVAIKLGLDTLQKARASGRREMVTTVVATAEIAATAPIERAMVRAIETPKTPLINSACYSNIDDVVGRVVAYSIPRGAVVRESFLTPKGTPPGLAVRIPPGYRAVSVKVNEVTGVAYQIQPGAFVDVIAVLTVSKGRRKETVSRIILQNIKVAAVGRALNTPNRADGTGKVAKSVTLLVKDTDAPRLHLAQTRGKLTLALRSGDDDSLSSSMGEAHESDLLGETDQPHAPTVMTVAHRPIRRHRSVLIVNGGQSREHEFGSGDDRAAVGDAKPDVAPVRAGSHGPASPPADPGSRDDDDEDAAGSGLDDGALPPG